MTNNPPREKIPDGDQRHSSFCERNKMKPNPIVLPYPDKRLSANSRIDRRWITAVRQEARDAGFFAVKAAGLVLQDVNLQLFIKICPPDRRGRDDDNVVTALKSYRDGIFQALGVNDKRVRLTSFGFGEPCKPGAVYIWIEPLGKLPEWLED